MGDWQSNVFHALKAAGDTYVFALPHLLKRLYLGCFRGDVDKILRAF